MECIRPMQQCALNAGTSKAQIREGPPAVHYPARTNHTRASQPFAAAASEFETEQDQHRTQKRTAVTISHPE